MNCRNLLKFGAMVAAVRAALLKRVKAALGDVDMTQEWYITLENQAGEEVARQLLPNPKNTYGVDYMTISGDPVVFEGPITNIREWFFVLGNTTKLRGKPRMRYVLSLNPADTLTLDFDL